MKKDPVDAARMFPLRRRDQGRWRTRATMCGLLWAIVCWMPGCAGVEQAKEPRAPAAPSPAVSLSGRAFVPDGYYESVPKLPKAGYFLKELAEGVYFFSTGAYNNLFVVTPKGVILTDPIGGKGRLLEKAIARVTDRPVKFIIYSHSHRRHIGSAHRFAAQAQIIAQVETRQRLERYNDPRRPLPNISFGSRYNLNFGGARLELIYPGEGHGKGNIMIYLPRHKILMFVDVATPRAVPPLNFAATDIYGQMKGIEKALELDFETYVAGHFFRPGKRSEMREVLEYYQAVKAADRASLKRVPLKATLARTRTRDIARLFGEHDADVAEDCYRKLKNEWKSRLMGFEAFARSHCNVWTLFHRDEQAPGAGE